MLRNSEKTVVSVRREVMETPQRRNDSVYKNEWNLREQPLKGRMSTKCQICVLTEEKGVGLMGMEDYIGGSTSKKRGGQITIFSKSQKKMNFPQIRKQ